MLYFDTHAHYFDERFSGEAEGILERLFRNTVSGIVNVATNPGNALEAVSQARRYPRMYTALGIHPEDAQSLSGEPEEEIARIRDMLLREDSRAVAVGEIGLDYHAEGCDRALQAVYFDLQMELAREVGLPVVVHDRDAHGDCFDTVLRHPGVIGVFHSFSGSPETARELTKRGWYISFSGTVSFKNAARVREAARAVPKDRLLIETDAPYLTPHPHRGERNDSGYLVYTCEALAEAIGESAEEVARVTGENARRLFGIAKDGKIMRNAE